MRSDDLKGFLKKQMDVKQKAVENDFRKELEQATKT
jgi:hypothetical protein